VATDGEVVFGQSAVDRSLLTGESQPLDVPRATSVVGGTVSTNGRLVVRATKVGRDTQLAQMLRLVEHAQNEKAAVQRLADRVCNVFVPGVLLIALGTLAAWLLLGYPSEQAFTAALAVLVIACPCALGLATPAALYVASGEGARAGIFFKGYRALEASKQVDTIVLDKTGTLTTGRMKVTDLACVPGTKPAPSCAWRVRWSRHRSIRSPSRSRRARCRRSVRFPTCSRSCPAGPGCRGIVEGHVSPSDEQISLDAVTSGLADHCAMSGNARDVRPWSSRRDGTWSERWPSPTPSGNRPCPPFDSSSSSACAASS
jgi:Cu+-exporting ATPase